MLSVPTSGGMLIFRGLAKRECSACATEAWGLAVTVVNRDPVPPGRPEAHLHFCGDCASAGLATKLGHAHVVAGGDASDLEWAR